MKAVDSSVVVAACACWHVAHELARRVVDAQPKLIAHCALEAFSVLTRLPAPHRVPARLVVEFLEDRFPEEPLTLTPTALKQLVSQLHRRGVVGGAVYDGLVALSAVAHQATLFTLDLRAADTYRRCEVNFKLLS